MMYQIFNRVYRGINGAWTFFHDLNEEFSFIDYIIALFLVYSIVRFIINPLLKGRAFHKGSDSVKKGKKDPSNE